VVLILSRRLCFQNNPNTLPPNDNFNTDMLTSMIFKIIDFSFKIAQLNLNSHTKSYYQYLINITRCTSTTTSILIVYINRISLPFVTGVALDAETSRPAEAATHSVPTVLMVVEFDISR
jgi:hypothetical protein